MMKARKFAAILAAFALTLSISEAAAEEVAATRTSQTIMTKGGDDVPIAVTISGNPQGRPILFVHGFLASTINWKKQLHSDLGDRYKLVSVDIRGHGSSGKPANREAYTDTGLVAQDIAAALRAAEVEKPLIVGWSYGGLFVMDYVRHFGTDNVAGIVFIETIGGMLPPPPPPPETPERTARIELSRSANIFTIKKWTDEFVDYWSAYEELPADEREMVELSAMLVPHYVRRQLRDHPVDNSDLVNGIDRKVLFLNGGESLSPKKGEIDQVQSLIAGSNSKTYPGYKSMVQWYNAAQINADIDHFYQTITP
ncbi:MAG: alpha/beta hydrolase [Pseudomonadota bacterium]